MYVCMYVLAMTRRFQQRLSTRLIWSEVAARVLSRGLGRPRQARLHQNRSCRRLDVSIETLAVTNQEIGGLVNLNTAMF